MEKITLEEFYKLQKLHAPLRSMCGKPVLHEEEKPYLFYEIIDQPNSPCPACERQNEFEGIIKKRECKRCASKIEYCPDCEKVNKLKTVKRECIKCAKKFIPGCMYRFSCNIIFVCFRSSVVFIWI